MTEEIMALCRAMGVGEGEDALLRPLVESAQGALAARLKSGVTPADCGAPFLLAAAMVAAEHLEQTRGGGGITAFTAGDVTIRREGGGGKGRSLSARAEGLLAPWLGETGFAFRGVTG